MAKAAPQNSTKQSPSDPIVGAIATHKRLDRKWLDMAHARDVATEAGDSGPSEHDVELASDAAIDAGWAMAETEPTTVAGAAAMLKYLTRDPQNGLFELGEVVWLETAFRTLERALSKMARETCVAGYALKARPQFKSV
jgi:hypothetical protein